MIEVGNVFKSKNGEMVTIVEVDAVRKTVMIETKEGKTRNLSFSTIKDKRNWTPVEGAKLSEDPKAMSDQEWEDSAKPKTPEMVPMPVNQKAAEEHIKQIQEDFHSDEPAPEKKAAKKTSSKRTLIEYNGKALTLHGWAKELGVPFGTLYARINRFNWTPEEALSGKKNK